MTPKQNLLFLTIFATCTSLQASPTEISKGGTPSVSIMHADGAHEAIVETVGELASILGRMTGGEFQIQVGGEPRGIILGTIAEFPGVPGGERFQPKDLLKQEEYIIHTDGERVWLIGASVAGASHAAWDFLFRLGFRQYFPGADWEIIPSRSDLVADFDLFETPDYFVRRFAWHYGNWPEFREETLQWTVRNRLSNRGDLPGTFVLYTLHVYSGVFKKHEEEIRANPAITSMLPDGRVTSKFNPANPRTIEIFEEYATEYFEKNPERGSISMDPSDGGGWGNSTEELAIGTPSDRAVFLANHVAKFINEKLGQKYVGIYSYNEHSPAPRNVRVHPNVIVSVATGFIHGGYTVEELLKEWGDAGAELTGIREYHSVVAWDLARPTGGRAANLKYLAETIPAFYKLGARFYITEAGPNWGPQGVGNYFTTRALWDVKEAANLDGIMEDFLTHCFPEAKEPMARFYSDLLHPARSRSLSEDFVGRMYRTLQEAKQMTTNPAALRRLDALTLYARYSELLKQYQNSRTGTADEQKQAGVDLMSFAYRIKDSQMVNSYALIRDLPARNKAIGRSEETDHRVPEGEHPWKDTTPITKEDIEGFLAEGIANNPLLDFEPVAFSTELVPARDLPAVAQSLRFRPQKPFRYNMRHVNRLHTWSENVGDVMEFTATPGTVYQA